jgi:anti-sigma B factor antagonist
MQVYIQFREEGEVLRGYVEGEIDTYTSTILRQELETVTIKGNQPIELNLSKVSYMDSTGLGIFVAFYKKVVREEGSLKLIGLSPRLMRLFEITGLSEFMNIESDEKVGSTNDKL